MGYLESPLWPYTTLYYGLVWLKMRITKRSLMEVSLIEF